MSVDGCNGNTGWKDGAVRHIEELVGRPLQWLVCVFHLAELVFRKFFIAVGKKIFQFFLIISIYEMSFFTLQVTTTNPLLTIYGSSGRQKDY